jgi:hypothetical protein
VDLKSIGSSTNSLRMMYWEEEKSHKKNNQNYSKQLIVPKDPNLVILEYIE